MNRGSVRLAGSVGPQRPASMRPRFMNRGSRIPQRSPYHWQIGFNEAPIHESGKFLRFATGRLGLGASMRPRFMNRGSRGPDQDI